MWRSLIIPFVCIAFAAAGWILSGIFRQGVQNQTIAMSWGDGKYGKHFYGAEVYLVPTRGEYLVHAKVHIGPGNRYYHDCGEIGRARTVDEAVEKWAKITWRPEGLDIGDPAAGGFHLPRSKMESHR